MKHHLDSLRVGDVMWLPELGNQSPTWLVTRIFEQEADHLAHASRHRVGKGWVLECVEFLELGGEEVETRSLPITSLNERMRIM